MSEVMSPLFGAVQSEVESPLLGRCCRNKCEQAWSLLYFCLYLPLFGDAALIWRDAG
jgi:hypothetical protein